MGFNSGFYLLLFILTQVLCFTSVLADFCDWFVCNPTEQYCCGNNVCCNYFNYNTLYLWGGAVMVGLLLVVLYYMLCSPSCISRPNPEKDTIVQQFENYSIGTQEDLEYVRVLSKVEQANIDRNL